MLNEDSTFFFDDSPRVIVIGDLHGDLERLIATLQTMAIINTDLDWTAEPKNTILVQLGDQVDSANRVPLGGAVWEKAYDIELVLFMDQLDKKARRAGGRVVSLLGNHELMNVLHDFSYVSQRSMEKSGGEALRRARFAPGGSWASILARRPVICKIGKHLFCHGGLLPWHIMACNGDIQILNRIVSKWLLRGPSALSGIEQMLLDTCVLGYEGILWTRNYHQMATMVPEIMPTMIDKVLQEMDASAIFVGHNTMDQVTPVLGGKVWFMDAQFSRAYGSNSVQVVEIRNHGEVVQTLTIGK